jgi:hypothetical protein
MAPAGTSAYPECMDRDARIADLRAILAAKRQQLEDHRLERIYLPPRELRRLQNEIYDEEQTLRDAGVSDV